MKKALRNIIYLVTLAAIAWFLYDQRDKLHLVRNITVFEGALLVVLTYISMLASSFIFKVTLSFFNIPMTYRFWYGITIVNTMYNYILPFKGGLALRGIYLKKNYNLKYAKYLSLVAGNFLVILLVSAIVGTVVGIMLFQDGRIDQRYFFTILAGLGGTLVVGASMFFGSNFRFTRDGKYFRVTDQILEGLGYFKENPSGMLMVLLAQVLFVLSMAYKLYMIFLALGIPSTFPELVFIQALVIFSRLFSFTPGNIGIREGVVGLSASILGMDIETAMLAALIDRIISIVFVFAFGAYYSKVLINDLDTEEGPGD